ncbi:MAG: chromate transporter [Clostridiales bacterium]|jgi:chromate transporter|nr:chromate transporter [Clostridiales bacterium]
MTLLKTLWQLFYTFIKIGGFTIGGGYAMVPIIQREAVDVKHWATEEEMLDIIALAPSMPGVIGVNTATALGSKVAGVPGALAATLGMVTPSLIVIVLIAWVFDDFLSIALVQQAFIGVRAAVAALMVSAVIRLAKGAVKDWFQIILFFGALFANLIFGVPAQYVLISCAALAVAAVALSLVRLKEAGKR